MSLPSIVRSPVAVWTTHAYAGSGSALDAAGLGANQDSRSPRSREYARDFVPATSGSSRPRNCGARLDDRHAAAEAAIRLGEFQADIAATEHDECVGKPVDFEHLNVGQRPASARPGIGGIVAWVPTLRKTRSPVSCACRRRSG